jgi:transposase
VTNRHRAAEFLGFLEQIERSVPKKLALHLILDNSSTHSTAEVKAFLALHPRIHLHFTPTSASWLNAVEGWFSQLERRSIRRGTFTSVQALRASMLSVSQLCHDGHFSVDSAPRAVAEANGHDGPRAGEAKGGAAGSLSQRRAASAAGPGRGETQAVTQLMRRARQ